jgi:hypothetical protein
MIRTANKDEESEKSNLIAEAFFWSSSNSIKVLKVKLPQILIKKMWKSIENWDAYSVFLHEVGHILGFRHEHVFLTSDERKAIGTDETSTGLELLQKTNIADTNSIMSYGYLRQFTKNCSRQAELSETDKLQAISYYKHLK